MDKTTPTKTTENHDCLEIPTHRLLSSTVTQRNKWRDNLENMLVSLLIFFMIRTFLSCSLNRLAHRLNLITVRKTDEELHHLQSVPIVSNFDNIETPLKVVSFVYLYWFKPSVLIALKCKIVTFNLPKIAWL